MIDGKLCWGVLGYAGIARKHVLPALQKSDNAILYGIASRSKEKQLEAKERFGFLQTYETYDELLNDEAIDVVYIPLPNKLHKEWVIKAAEKGKHILCEKPLSLTSQDCEEMVCSAKKNDVFLMEAFMYRFTNRTKKLKEIVNTGVIGEIKTIKSSYRFKMDSFDTDDIRLNAELAGGALHDVGCYPVNIIGMLMNEAPVKIKALKESYRGVDISLSAILKYRNGAIATLDCGFNSESALLTEIAGTKGTIVLRDTFIDTDASIFVIQGSSGEVTKYELEASDRYYEEVIAVNDAILSGKKELLPWVEAIRNNQLISDILEIAED